MAVSAQMLRSALGEVVGFGRRGWPLVRLEAQTVLVDPAGHLLVRGQQLKLSGALDSLKILELLEVPRRKKCIHPTRVAGLCKSCPRLKTRR